MERSDDLTEAEVLGLRRLWAEAFDDFTDDDADHAMGGVHVIAVDGDRIVAHASGVPRRLQVGRTWHDAGYVEAVATSPDRQGERLGTAVMERLQVEIDRRWPFAMLSTGRSTGFYSRLGWEPWDGTSYTLTDDGSVVADGEHGGLMVRRPGIDLDLTAAVTCEDRPGDAW